MSHSNKNFAAFGSFPVVKENIKILRFLDSCTVYLPAVAPPDMMMFTKCPLTRCIYVKDKV